jgi:hypothetical protein
MARQSPELPGSVQRQGKSGWRVQVRIDENICFGPIRRDKVDAEADLREMKEAPTREAMKTRMHEIKVRQALYKYLHMRIQAGAG